MRILALTVLLALSASSTSAYDTSSPFQSLSDGEAPLYAVELPALFVHNAGPLQVMVTNMGVIGNPRSGIHAYGARWHGAEHLHAIELWVGALAGQDLSYVSSGYEFRPSLDPVDTIYPSFAGAPGGNRQGLGGGVGDDDGDGLTDEESLNGKDDDGDGRIDEDYAAIAQEMFSCEYWDDTREAVRSMAEHRPLGLHVHQETYAWSLASQNEFIGIEYEITNAGDEILYDVYAGCAFDGDVGRKEASGYWQDDRALFVMIDTLCVNPDIDYQCHDAYAGLRDCSVQRVRFPLLLMGDVRGEDGGNRGDDVSPGEEGLAGIVLLDHTTDIRGLRAPSRVAPHAVRIYRKRENYEFDDVFRYDMLAEAGIDSDSTQVPADYAGVISVGPFRELHPGDKIRLTFAFVVGLGYQGLVENAIQAERIHHGVWRNLDDDRFTGCYGHETCLFVPPGGEPFFWNDPCVTPSRRVLIKNHDCSQPRYWVNNDCNCCTPIQGRSGVCTGNETLVPWVGRLAPPPPNLNTDPARRSADLAGDRRIHLAWDNLSELVADPFSQERRFCGYRIWRVEGWQRPQGAHGPAPEDWQLIAELVRDPRGHQLDLEAHTDLAAPIVAWLPAPEDPDEELPRYAVGRYTFTDSIGLKNGMLYFYDVTSFSCWYEDGEYHEVCQPPAAIETEGVRPRWDAAPGASWRRRLAVVPNPYRGQAAWDLRPSRHDPLGTRVEFVHLPGRPCTIRIYTLAGDLVQTLQHDGRSGTLPWNLLTRNGQDVTSGVYLYSVACGGERVIGRLTVVR